MPSPGQGTVPAAWYLPLTSWLLPLLTS